MGMLRLSLDLFLCLLFISLVKSSTPPEPTGQPSGQPSGQPTGSPTGSPTGLPTGTPTFIAEPYAYHWDRVRHRVSGMCANKCSGHGTCQINYNCKCYNRFDGSPKWTGADCSLHTCPQDYAWVGSVVNANDLHPVAECSNRGMCNRQTGECDCFTGYEGLACQRTTCLNNCNDHGTCWPQKFLANFAGKAYTAPWDASKIVGCLCDAGFRGPSCELMECPSSRDPLGGFGNESGRDCSGRGICDYSTGHCTCFPGFIGARCEKAFILA